MSLTADELLSDDMAGFFSDPLGYVMYIFPWDTDPAIQAVDWENEDVFVDPATGMVYNAKPNTVETITFKELMAPYRERYNSRYGPDKWACEFLDEWGEEIKKRGFTGVKAVDPIQFVTKSGHGIGKSTLVAWIIKFISDTRPYSKGTVTANTSEQLRTKTWAELGKWHKRSLTAHWFDYNSGRGNMSLRNKEHPEEWFCQAQTCREENSEAFAGQHAANSTSYYVFDEDSAVPDKIHEVREGGTTDGEPMTFDFGNPTRNSGSFYEECEGKFAHRYIVRSIDSRTVYITNKKRLADWITDYGIGSDFVKVRVLGLFPSAGSLQFNPTSWVKRAMLRELTPDRMAALTIGVDVARFGDDNSVIYPVIGNDARTWAPIMGDGIYNGLDNVQLAHKVMEKVEFFRSMGVECAGIFVDVTGLGSGVVDTLVHAGYDPVAVNFGTTPIFQPELYRYRVDEMWGRAKYAIRDKLVLPSLPYKLGGNDNSPTEKQVDTCTTLLNDLTQREFGYTLNGEKTQLETKKDMKKRGLKSPDIADGLVLNFAQDVAPPRQAHGMGGGKPLMTNHEYDPIANVSVG